MTLGPSPATGTGRAIASFLAAVTLAGVAMVLLVRWSDVSSPVAVAVAGLTLFAAIPLAVSGLFAIAGRSRVLQVSWVLVLAVYVATVSPVHAVVGCGPTPGPADLTVLTANVLRTADDPAGVAAMVASADADVVVLQEVSPSLWRSLADNPDLAELGFRSLDQGLVEIGPRSTLVLVMSKLDVRSARLHGLGAAGGLDLEAVLPESGQAVAFTGVHLNSPSQSVWVGPWRHQLSTLAARPVDGPGVIAGDFNATEDHRPFRRLLDAGWTDVHQTKGCGFWLTFPVDDTLPFPVMRLDHVLVTDHFEVLDVELLSDANESDHRPVLTRLRLSGD